MSKKRWNNKKNKYEFYDNYGICYATNGVDKILFSLEDYDKIKNYNWYVYANSKSGYKTVQTKINRKIVILSNFLLETKFIDHINGDSLDNRRENLRPYIDKSGYSKNILNTKISKNNTSGHKGVYWDKQASKWKGRLQYKGKVYQKFFKDFEDACKWVDYKRAEIHGDFANFGKELAFQDLNYDIGLLINNNNNEDLDMVKYVTTLVSNKLTIDSNCKHIDFNYKQKQGIVEIESHTNKYTELFILWDLDEKDKKYKFIKEYKFKNNWVLNLEPLT